ncbi:MAG: HAMP domain-containing histidine kinase [Blautia sp.]|nr:HAMP domain-containing histidine kinase [Blautia sp.]
MKNAVWAKIVFFTIVLGLTGILFFSASGMYLIEGKLTDTIGEQYYRETVRIAKSSSLSEESVEDTSEAFRLASEFASEFQQCMIWHTDRDGRLIEPSGDSVPGFRSEYVLLLYQELQEEEVHFQVSNFYDCFEEDWINIVTPVLSGEAVSGYIVVHYPMERIYRYRDSFHSIMLLLLNLCYCLGLVPLFLYRGQICTPLQNVIDGVARYSTGDYSSRIPAGQDRNIGYLGSSLNYLADQLDRTGKYQRQLISNVSHDFRSPLTSIKGYVSAMLDGTIAPDDREKYLQIILHETERLEKLTQNLQALEALEVDKKMLHYSVFDIKEILYAVQEFFSGPCRQKQLQVSLRLPPSPLMVSADREKIQQVVYNLMDNAIKFSPPFSMIFMEAYEQNERVFVTVKDQGIGIPASSIGKIWNRFYKEDNSRGKDQMGSGLGLSIVKEIIAAHDEHINVISTEGIGTEFIFTLKKAAVS